MTNAVAEYRPMRLDRMARLLAGLQFAYVAWFSTCAWLALARAAHFAGHYYIPSLGDRYTADADVTGGWPWAGPIMFTATGGLVFAMLSLPAAAGLMLIPSVRRRRAVFVSLLVASLLVLATIVTAATPAGRSVIDWVLD